MTGEAGKHQLTIEAVQEFSNHVYARRYDAATKAAINILHAIEMEGNYIQVKGAEVDASKVLTQFTSAFTALLANPEVGFSRTGLGALLSLKSVLHRVFSMTSFVDMSHIYPLIGTVRDGQVTISEEALPKFLIVTTVDIMEPITLDVIQSLDDEIKMLFWLSLLDLRYLLKETEEQKVAQLLVLMDSIKTIPMKSVGEVELLNRVWFRCSYWDFDGKHLIKKKLNESLLLTARNLGVKDQAYFPPRKEDSRPRILVILELWTYNSAMFRCYEKAISSLQSNFHVTGLARRTQMVREETNRPFDEVIELSTNGELKENVIKVLNAQPDIIFYPSIGMSATVTQMSQLRLAPVQVMASGHPATSYSSNMDYLVVDEDVAGDPSCFSETILEMKIGGFKLTKPDFDIPDAIAKDRPGDCLQIVVNSMYHKLTPRFLSMCSEIAEKADRQLHFHFLCGANPLIVDRITGAIAKGLSVECHNMLPYLKYIEIVQKCDLQLTPFPFGNSNGFVDAMLMAVPTVCLDGPEIHSHADVALAQRVGLPEVCQTQSYDEYLDVALRLIHDDDLRLSIHRQILDTDIEKALFQQEEDTAMELGNVFDWLLQNHQHIQKEGRGRWSVQDRLEYQVPVA